jgi:hypothetical protein
MSLNQNNFRGKDHQTKLAISSTGGTVTLTEDQCRCEFLALTGAITTASVIQFCYTPKDAGKMVWVDNAQTNGGSATTTLKAYTADGGTTPTTGATITQAKKALFIYDGADFVQYTADT